MKRAEQLRLRELAVRGIELEIAELTALLQKYQRPTSAAKPPRKPHRRFSPEARKAISERMKARWAAVRQAKKTKKGA